MTDGARKNWLLGSCAFITEPDEADDRYRWCQIGGFQSQVNVSQAPAVEGDFCAFNQSRSLVLAGPGGLVAGPGGVTTGRFAWFTGPVDLDGTPTQVTDNYNGFAFATTNFASGGTNVPAGFLRRSMNALNTTYLSDASMVVPAGFPVELFSGGDFWVKNAGTSQALVGHKAYANLATGQVTFGATGSPTQSASITASITPALATITASIAGNILTVTSVASGTLTPGMTLTGTAGTIAANTAITEQLSGSIGAVGTYSLNIGEQTYASATVSGSVGLMNVSAVASGTIGLGATLGGTAALAANTIVVATNLSNPGLGLTGTGNTGTYYVSPSQTLVINSIVTMNGNVETKWIAASTGLPGELVKMTSHLFG